MVNVPADRICPDLDWVIVGGGVHGVHVAICLIEDAGVPLERLRIVDPEPQLLARWRTCASRTGMTHLRSPSMHHIGIAPYALYRFAASRGTEHGADFTAPNDRPSLELFNAHSDDLVERFGLGSVHVRARASAMELQTASPVVTLDQGAPLRASRVVLALGSGDQLRWPAWAPRDDRRVQHIFSPKYQPSATPARRVAVVGGGITAAQVALDHVRRGHLVDLISRHKARTQQYDADPGWFGPKHMADFARLQSLSERRQVITQGRHRGSVPPDVQDALRCAVEAGDLCHHVDGIQGLEDVGDGLRVALEGGRRLGVASLVLATGYTPWRPGGRLVETLVSGAHLPLSPCGYPVVDRALRWHPRVHVTGALAELELGPIARNIAGARRASDRILAVANTRRPPSQVRSGGAALDAALERTSQ